jgi:hypothetical protein
VKRLDVDLFAGPVQRAPGDALLLLLPEEERPLRGDAGIVDWRLAGKISKLLSSGFCSGQFGEATLMPADARLAAGRVLLVGVGPLRALHGRGLERALTLAGAKLLGMRARTGVLALPEGLDLGGEAGALLVGLGRAVAIAQGGAQLGVVVPEAIRRGRALRRAWPKVVTELHALGVDARLENREPREAGGRLRPPIEVAR